MRQRNTALLLAHLEDVGFRYETSKKVEYENWVSPVEPQLTHSYPQTIDEVLDFSRVAEIPLSIRKVQGVIPEVQDPVKPVGAR